MMSFTTVDKALAGGVAAAGAALTQAFLDGHVTGGEWVTVVTALVVGFLGVYAAKNAPKG